MKIRAGVLILSGAAAMAPFSLPAAALQDPAGSGKATAPLVIQVGVDLIQIDAAITDKMGNPVTDLRAEELTVLVDGKKAPVTNVMFFGKGPATTVAEPNLQGAPAPAAASPDRTVLFLVDDLNVSFSSMYSAKRAMQKFAQGWDVREARLGMVFTSDESGTIRLSRSSERFTEAVNRISYNTRSSKGASSAPTFPENPESTGGSGGPRFTVDLSPISANPAMNNANVQQRAFSLLSTINALRSVPGRKALVFVSEGFDVAGNRDGLEVRSPFDTLFGADNDHAYRIVRMITEVANRASVVIYTIDPSGLVSDLPGIEVAGAPSPERRREAWFTRVGTQGTLQQLAADTGGLSVYNRNDLNGGLNEVIGDQRAYYLVGFEPPKAAFAKGSARPRFHQIKLTVNRPDVRVRTRAGFFGVTDAEVIYRAPLMTSPEF